MIVYEVNVDIEEELAGPYEDWLKIHAAEVNQIGNFLSYEIFKRASSPHFAGFTVLYRSSSQKNLDLYLKDHAPRLRADAEKLFGGKFTATRRILNPL